MESARGYSANDVLDAIFNDTESEGESELGSEESSESEDDFDVEFTAQQERILRSTLGKFDFYVMLRRDCVHIYSLLYSLQFTLQTRQQMLHFVSILHKL